MIDRELVALLASIQKIRDELTSDRDAIEVDKKLLQSERERFNAEIGDLKSRLVAAERNKERFRYALFVYLQERDGLLGVHAPSNDTLRRIRELLEEPPTD